LIPRKSQPDCDNLQLKPHLIARVKFYSVRSLESQLQLLFGKFGKPRAVVRTSSADEGRALVDFHDSRANPINEAPALPSASCCTPDLLFATTNSHAVDWAAWVGRLGLASSATIFRVGAEFSVPPWPRLSISMTLPGTFIAVCLFPAP
jgi:hypothetical protein